MKNILMFSALALMSLAAACKNRDFNATQVSSAKDAGEEKCGVAERGKDLVRLRLEENRVHGLQGEDGATLHALDQLQSGERICITADWSRDPASVESVAMIRRANSSKQEWCGYIEKSGETVSLNMEDGRGVRELQGEDAATVNVLNGFQAREHVCVTAEWAENPVSVTSAAMVRRFEP